MAITFLRIEVDVQCVRVVRVVLLDLRADDLAVRTDTTHPDRTTGIENRTEVISGISMMTQLFVTIAVTVTNLQIGTNGIIQTDVNGGISLTFLTTVKIPLLGTSLTNVITRLKLRGGKKVRSGIIGLHGFSRVVRGLLWFVLGYT
ncbi:MAG: hypothetical protein JRC86_11585 [Deltaproteobacteria bacterium]|nr:hypothetical protein [Deltaproteobacteria bacterium]